MVEHSFLFSSKSKLQGNKVYVNNTPYTTLMTMIRLYSSSQNSHTSVCSQPWCCLSQLLSFPWSQVNNKTHVLLTISWPAHLCQSKASEAAETWLPFKALQWFFPLWSDLISTFHCFSSFYSFSQLNVFPLLDRINKCNRHEFCSIALNKSHALGWCVDSKINSCHSVSSSFVCLLNSLLFCIPSSLLDYQFPTFIHT